jgi:nucleotidyltransferase substrate binding protein (TIGR01987 family)
MSIPRWHLRNENFAKAISNLREATTLFQTRPLSIVEQAGLIQLFEVAWELGWKLMYDYQTETGITVVRSPVATIRSAFSIALISDGDGWMEATKLRHSLSHEYDENRAAAALALISDRYLALFVALAEKLGNETRSDNSA